MPGLGSLVLVKQSTSEEQRIVGTQRSDYIPGGAYNDTLLGRGGNDTILGGTGNDRIDGGAGNDVHVGGWTNFKGDVFLDQMGDQLRVLDRTHPMAQPPRLQRPKAGPHADGPEQLTPVRHRE